MAFRREHVTAAHHAECPGGDGTGWACSVDCARGLGLELVKLCRAHAGAVAAAESRIINADSASQGRLRHKEDKAAQGRAAAIEELREKYEDALKDAHEGEGEGAEGEGAASGGGGGVAADVGAGGARAGGARAAAGPRAGGAPPNNEDLRRVVAAQGAAIVALESRLTAMTLVVKQLLEEKGGGAPGAAGGEQGGE